MTAPSMPGFTDEEFAELLADACEGDYLESRRESAWMCCFQCGVEFDAEYPPHYNVAWCKHGSRDCRNERHRVSESKRCQIIWAHHSDCPCKACKEFLDNECTNLAVGTHERDVRVCETCGRALECEGFVIDWDTEVKT